MAKRIVTRRFDLVPQILVRPLEGRPGYVSRGICVHPLNFDPQFKPNQRSENFPYFTKVFVAGEGFGVDSMALYRCPGGITLEMQIPRFLFSGWSSFVFRKSYTETNGAWGYLLWRQVPDLSPFITRVEVEALDGTATERLSYEEFQAFIEQQRSTGAIAPELEGLARRPGKKPRR